MNNNLLTFILWNQRCATLVASQIWRFVDFVKIFKDFEIYIQKAALGNLVTFFSKMELLQYKYLVDIIAVDFIKAGEHRFRISYVIKSFFNYEYLHLIFFIKELESIMSIKKIYFGAGWLERELWDMFGIIFYNHFDLRRILTDYAFKGYPLRKDFPQTGYLELRYDDTKEYIVYEPLELAQEFRFFNLDSGWEAYRG